MPFKECESKAYFRAINNPFFKKCLILYWKRIELGGAFHSTQNSGNFGWYIKGNEPFRFGRIGIFGTSFEGGPL